MSFVSRVNNVLSKLNGKLNKFSEDKLLRLEIIILQCVAMWPIYCATTTHPLSRKLRAINLFYYLFVDFIILHTAVFFLVEFIRMANSEYVSIIAISDVFAQTIIYFFASFANIWFQIHHDELSRLISFVNRNFRKRSSIGLSYIAIQPTQKLCFYLTVSYLSAGILTTVYYVVSPMFDGIHRLPMQCWYPFDLNNRTTFILLYSVQILTHFLLSVNYVICAQVIIITCLLMSSQFDMLFCDLKNIHYTSLMLKDYQLNRKTLRNNQIYMPPVTSVMGEYFYSSEHLEDLEDEKFIKSNIVQLTRQLREYVRSGMITKPGTRDNYLLENNTENTFLIRQSAQHHQMLLRVCNMIEDFYNPFVFVKSIQLTSQLCNLSYVLVKTSITMNIGYLIYLSLTLIDLFIFGFSGDLIENQTLNVSDAVYRSPWHLCGGPFRRTVGMMQSNSMQPFLLTGGKFYILDYVKVIEILKAAFSFYTMLQNLSN